MMGLRPPANREQNHGEQKPRNPDLQWNTPDDFYRERGGAKSTEYDFGVLHYCDTEAHEPVHVRDRWRVSVVEATGDVYAISEQTQNVRILGTFPTEGISRQAFTTHMDRIFVKWSDSIRPLSWFRNRLEQAGYKATAAAG